MTERIRVRAYGSPESPVVVLLHGGPGTPGYLAPVARRLAGSFHVLEPLQRTSGGAPLTVATHVADLRTVLDELDSPSPPHLVGHSWGAMLALAYAAAHPATVGSLALVACGTWDRRSRRRLEERYQARLDPPLRRRLARLRRDYPDPDERLRETGRLILPVYSHQLADHHLPLERCDDRGHRESWGDMVRLQAEGVYPAAFAAVRAPVLMLHGAEDPHPGAMIRDSLAPWLPQLTYREWPACGHYPWLERAVREEFFERLERWLAAGGLAAAAPGGARP